ncbi:hypothetical protein FLAG1_08703 [Fusarium langsethiae]|uniref:Uncharacterized protein n=1 Tax=Fusarium langsethiae TaxID=179993 RepID=A0A0M9ES23_FUSLA|nr:hypothetical protein FLAG1_08703 [Fusarium langsethiae]GKU06872.1 unnamed protein product [Fusarium langsethiae]GKU21735.1 unnamed protein product [Fusarium langsethiae]
MKTHVLLASLFASGALAQSAVADCHRENSPDWNDCDDLWDSLGWQAGNPREITRNCGRDTDMANECLVYYQGLCQVAQCLTGSECIGTSEGRMATSKTIVESQCRRDDLGGRVTDNPNMYFEIIRYTGVPGRLRRSLPFGKKSYSLAEYERRFGKDRDVVFSKVIDQDNDKVEKRQSGEWINLVTRQGVIKPGERQRVNSNELAPGIDFTWEESSSYTIEVGATAGVSASLFEIFSASMEVSTSYSETFTAGSSLKYNSGNCPNNANVYYAPVYTMYEGIFSDDESTTYEIWVPQTVNGVLEGRFVVECVGTTPPN